jgi:lipopolysaccharide/colanic/teichoic acid biosynthesis glycosyltransferase
MYRPAKASSAPRTGNAPAGYGVMASAVLRRLGASAALAFAIVPGAITACVLLLVLGRPLSFTQLRCGLEGRHIVIRKFRTMYDIRDSRGVLMPDADRMTRVTRLIRRLRLDEIPQFLAVFRGDLAFVGPRPLTPEVVAKFGRAGMVRCSVPPGLTGWAQVNGNTLLSDPDKLALDIWYVDHKSLPLDFLIFARTIAMLVLGERIDRDSLAQARSHYARRFPDQEAVR